MVFFLNADEQIYARYGGRDSEDPESRMSLAGLRYTMQLILNSHRNKSPDLAPRKNENPLYIRQLTKFRKSGGCIHCHEAKEMIYADLKHKGQWSRDLVWRYPLPESLGFALEVDRGNVVKTVKPDSPAKHTGLKVGDILLKLDDIPIRSFADAQFSLDRAPNKGHIKIAWKRNGKSFQSQLALPDGWRMNDFTWRPSVWRLGVRLFLFGKDLPSKEKVALGLSPKQTAFRQEEPVTAQARSAGIRAGDIIIGVDNKNLELGVKDFLRYVRFHYVEGDHIVIDVLRDGKRLQCPLTFR